MAIVTIEDAEKRLEHYRHLGIKIEPYSLDDLAKTDQLTILWVKYDDWEVWEILPGWLAKLVLQELPHQRATRAKLYRRLPPSAPDDIVRQWLEIKLRKAGGEQWDSITMLRR